MTFEKKGSFAHEVSVSKKGENLRPLFTKSSSSYFFADTPEECFRQLLDATKVTQSNRRESLALMAANEGGGETGLVNFDYDGEGEMWEGLIRLETVVKHRTKPNRCLQFLYAFFTTARLYFFIIAAVNIAILACSVNGVGPHAAHYRNKALTLCLWNVLPTMVVRNEVVHYLLHEFFVVVGKHAPHFVKPAIVEGLLHLGGIHAGCGTFSLMWLTYACYKLNTTEYAPKLLALIVDLIVGLLGIAIFSALPPVRYFVHNWFEIGHRFAGWSALGLLWLAVFLSYSFELEVIMAQDNMSFTTKQNYRHLRVHEMFVNPEIYIVMICTFVVIFPWLEMQKVAVVATFPSPRVAILTFKGFVPAGRFGRLSRSPLLEWHAFAISSTIGTDEHFMICGAVGDWTNALHTDPPTYLYTRRFKFTGLPRMIELFKRVLLVCTGAGIAVPVSYFWQNRYPDSEGNFMRLLWIASNTEETYGREWTDRLMATGRVILYDTSNRPRPDALKLTLALYKKLQMEAVFVTCNPTITSQIILGCEQRGVTAFGPVFDS